MVHEHCVVKCAFPEDLAIYSPMGCGYQTGAGTVLNILKPKPDQTVAVFGAGSVGFAAIMAAAATSVGQIIAVDIVEPKLALAKELGATHTINTSNIKGTVIDEVMAMTGSRGVDFAIDTTGVSAVVEKMLDCLAYGGTAASVGAPPREERISVGSGAFFAGKKTWLSVAEGDSHPPEVVVPCYSESSRLLTTNQFIPKLIELHRQGKFPVEKISKVYPVAELKKAISDMKNGTVRLRLDRWRYRKLTATGRQSNHRVLGISDRMSWVVAALSLTCVMTDSSSVAACELCRFNCARGNVVHMHCCE